MIWTLIKLHNEYVMELLNKPPQLTKFNPENKDSLTYEESLSPAMKITEQEDADQYFKDYVEWMTKNFKDADGKYTPEEVCKINLGYYAAYYDLETRERVERLFITRHPVFGALNKTEQQ
jgi:hypothetical protein